MASKKNSKFVINDCVKIENWNKDNGNEDLECQTPAIYKKILWIFMSMSFLS